MRNLKLTDNPGSAPKICSELEFQTQSGPSISLDANFASGKSPGTSSSVQSLSRVQLFATPWTAARQASSRKSITNSQSLRKLMSIKSVMPSNHLIFCHPLFLPPSIFPSIRVFTNFKCQIRLNEIKIPIIPCCFYFKCYYDMLF